MKKTYCTPNLSIQYISLNSAIMSEPGATNDQGNNSGGLGVPTRLYI